MCLCVDELVLQKRQFEKVIFPKVDFCAFVDWEAVFFNCKYYFGLERGESFFVEVDELD